MDYIIETQGLTKKYGVNTVVNQVCMNVKKGDIYGFIGRNGAGKTTTMKLILGTAAPNAGTIRLFDSDDLDAGRKRTGSLIEEPGLYKNCSAWENMKRFSILYGGDDRKIIELLELVGLDKAGNKKVGAFSLGMRQRLGIAVAMLGDPELLVLDEPVNGLDPAGIKEVRDLIQRINRERGVTVLISSHLLDELSKVATKFGVIHNGVLLEEFSAQELYERCKQCLQVTVDDSAAAAALLQAACPALEVTAEGRTLTLPLEGEDSAEINRILVSGGVKVSELSVRQTSFEDYFIERIGGKA